MKMKIGVMGSASGPTIKNKSYLKKAYQIGKAIAENNCFFINGACPGLPEAAAKGAKEAGGFVLGVSPAFSLEEHIKDYKSPYKNHNFILYSGLGLMERDVINIRTSDGVIILGGGIGSLNEFTIAYDEGFPIGILTNTGGISNHIPDILKACDRPMRKNIILEKNPKILVEKVIEAIRKHPKFKYEDERIKNNNYNGK